jgi:hypothetical protein
MVIIEAMEQRNINITKGIQNSELFGDWSSIIDAIKSVLILSRDLASNNFQKLINFGMNGEQNKVNEFLDELKTAGYIDHLFTGILDETLSAYADQRNQSDNYFMLQYFKKTIDFLNETEELNNNNNNFQKLSVIEENSKSSKFVDKNNKMDEKIVINKSDELSLKKMQNYLTNLLHECQGDVNMLKNKVIESFINGDINLEALSEVIEENIKICKTSNYVNKLKIFTFIKDLLIKEGNKENDKINAINETLLQNNENNENLLMTEELNNFSTHHSPKFIGKKNNNNKKIIKKQLLTTTTTIDASNTQTLEKIKNKKKKMDKKKFKTKVNSLADRLALQLKSNGYAICDNFLPLDLVKRVRVEAGIFKKYYEQSEIWVGKVAEADLCLFFYYYYFFLKFFFFVF